jgi:hypothetical protein
MSSERRCSSRKDTLLQLRRMMAMQPAALIAAALTGSAPRRSESGSCIARETSMRLHLATIKASTRPTASSDRSRHPADSGLRAAWSPPAGFYPAVLGERVGRCPLLMLWTAPPPADNNRSHRAPARDSCGSTHHIFRACAVPPYRTLLRETPGAVRITPLPRRSYRSHWLQTPFAP